MHREELFWSKVDKKGPDECWEWKGHIQSKGYGQWTTGHVMGISSLAHRVAYVLTFGPIIDSEMLVCHSCDNRKCCNPRHLWLGTDEDNTQDALSKGRLITPRGSQSGASKLTEEQAMSIYGDDRLYKDIAHQYGVSDTTVAHIKSKRYWRHIHAS